MNQYKVEIKNIESNIYTIEANTEAEAKQKALNLFDAGVIPTKSYERKLDVHYVKTIKTKEDKEKEEQKFRDYTYIRVYDYMEACLSADFDMYATIEDLAPISTWEDVVASLYDHDLASMTMKKIGLKMLSKIKYDKWLNKRPGVAQLQENLQKMSRDMEKDGYSDFWNEWLDE